MSLRFSALAAALHLCSDRLNRVTEIVLFFIGFGMAVLIGVQVFSRYLLNHSLFWSEETGRICLVWISFLGASAAYKRHAHVGVDFLVARLPDPMRRFLTTLVILASLAFFVILIVYGFAFAGFVSLQKTAALGLSLSVPYLVIPVSGVIFFVHGVSHLVQLLDRDEDIR